MTIAILLKKDDNNNRYLLNAQLNKSVFKHDFKI